VDGGAYLCYSNSVSFPRSTGAFVNMLPIDVMDLEMTLPDSLRAYVAAPPFVNSESASLCSFVFHAALFVCFSKDVIRE
jgi:hypothetical protein